VFAAPGGTYSPPQTLLLKWAAPRGGEGNVEMRRGKKGKGWDRKRRSGLSPQKKSSGHPCFNLLLNWFIDRKLLIDMGSSFRISLRLYLILLLQKFFTQS